MKSPLDRLADNIEKILQEYEGEVLDKTDSVLKDISKAGARAVRQSSPKKSGEYSRGWTVTIEGDRVAKSAYIHNGKLPGLPHLLENGHVTKNGTGRTYGNTKAHVHIAPVEQMLIETYEKRLTEEL